MRLSPKNLFRAIMLEFLLLVGCSTAFADVAGCPHFNPPEVRVDLKLAPVVYTYGDSYVDLTRRGDGRAHPTSGKGDTILGLSEITYDMAENAQVKTLPMRDGSWCVAATKIIITIEAKTREVLVAKELPQQSCIFGEVLGHEMKHVHTDEAILGQYVALLNVQIPLQISRLTPVRTATQGSGYEQIRAFLDGFLHHQFDDMKQDRDHQQMNIDTPQEYHRVAVSCDGEIKKYLNRKTPRL